MVEALEPFKLHPTSVSIIYKVFELLRWLWMGMWLHTHTIITTDADVCLDLGELAETLTLCDVGLQTMSLCYG